MLTSSVRLLVLVLASAWAGARSPECSEAVLSTGGRSLMTEVDTVLTVESADSRSVECDTIFTFSTNIFPVTSPDCEVRLRLLAVGGGGDGDAFSGNAGGSGQVVFTEVGLVKCKRCFARAFTLHVLDLVLHNQLTRAGHLHVWSEYIIFTNWLLCSSVFRCG